MKKKITYLFLGISVFIACIVSSAIAIPIVSLNLVQTDTIYANSSFDVEVLLNDAGDSNGLVIDELLIAFGFDVDDSASIFEFNSYEINASFDDESDNIPNDVAGLSKSFGEAYVDAYILATLSFKTLDAGTETLNILAENDYNFRGLYYDDVGMFGNNASLEITVAESNAPVPEPATMFLLGIGIVGLCGYRRILRK